MLKYMNKFGCLPHFQSAYRKFNSIETALCGVYSDLIRKKAEGKCSKLELSDLNAAFDAVDHHKLLCDLENFGCDWIINCPGSKLRLPTGNFKR